MFPPEDLLGASPAIPQLPAPPKPAKDNKNEKKRPRDKSEPLHLRKAAGKVWNDPTLLAWPENDHRVFCGDLGNEVTDEMLANAFRHYQSFNRARVVRDNRTGKTKGYGFVSFNRPEDMLAAIKEMNRKYVGNRPIRVLKSKWKVREIDSQKNKADAGHLRILPTNSKHLRRFKLLQREEKQQTAAATTTASVKKESTVNKTFSSEYWLNRFKEGGAAPAAGSQAAQP